MSNKVVMVLVDGMRPDAMLECGHGFVRELMSKSAYTMSAKTVMPSVTLPCHMSLFHSVDPSRHGVTANVYAPMARPVDGLVEILAAFGKKCAFFFTWEQLRDLARPGSLSAAQYINLVKNEDADRKITEAAIPFIKEELPDFTFVYLGETDEFGGHGYGWMSKEYLGYVNRAWDCIEKIYYNLPEDYTLIVLADHGGHERTHGTEMPEDMTVPVMIYGKDFSAGKELSDVSIKDIAPTVANILEVKSASEWEGKIIKTE